MPKTYYAWNAELRRKAAAKDGGRKGVSTETSRRVER